MPLRRFVSSALCQSESHRNQLESTQNPFSISLLEGKLQFFGTQPDDAIEALARPGRSEKNLGFPKVKNRGGHESNVFLLSFFRLSPLSLPFEWICFLYGKNRGFLMGRRFYATQESTGGQNAKERIREATGDDTLRSTVFVITRRIAVGILIVYRQVWHGTQNG
jgi:hypothetical protein